MLCKYVDSQHARDDRHDGDGDHDGGGDRVDGGSLWHRSANPLICRHDGQRIEAFPCSSGKNPSSFQAHPCQGLEEHLLVKRQTYRQQCRRLNQNGSSEFDWPILCIHSKFDSRLTPKGGRNNGSGALPHDLFCHFPGRIKVWCSTHPDCAKCTRITGSGHDNCTCSI